MSTNELLNQAKQSIDTAGQLKREESDSATIRFWNVQARVYSLLAVVYLLHEQAVDEELVVQKEPVVAH